MMRTISHDEARQFYDKFGAKQDQQGFYEDPALDLLVELGNFSEAEDVFEFGCGTGRLAARLLANHLPSAAHYVGVDLSPTMMRLAQDRLAEFRERTEIHLSDGAIELSRYGGPFDRFVTTYVLDLLSPTDIRQCLAETHMVLASGGLFCHAGLTKGKGLISITASSIWSLVHRINPLIVGGCRPLRITDFLSKDQWRLIERKVVVGSAIPSEVIVAEAR